MTKLIAIGEIGIVTALIVMAALGVIGACIVLYPLRSLIGKPPGNPNRKDPFHP